ncbi:MAG: hypothetical protein K8F25_02625 [Fimbriimonadaceae bacterium]|nr:hypothetical protein [Alphaproteobacteria bacterium]
MTKKTDQTNLTEEQMPEIVTAAVLAIGDELLSGRTKDLNIGYIAEFLTAMGIDMREARIVSDDEPRIVEALNALRAQYDYVFTTGGIGPTHDDITADAVAKAFGVGIDYHPEAVRLLEDRYKRMKRFKLNEARLRMARIPDGAELIENKVSTAPGFHIGNVFVFAGVPCVMQVMLDAAAPLLKGGKVMESRTIHARIAEGDFAPALGDIQNDFPDVVIGSYPYFKDGKFGTNIVVRSRDDALLEAAAARVTAALENIMATLNTQDI